MDSHARLLPINRKTYVLFQLGQFISSLGGILGLYIGFSILTILEFCELAFDMVALGLFKWSSKNKTKPRPAS